MPNYRTIGSAAFCFGLLSAAVQPVQAAGVFDELRFGGVSSFVDGKAHEDGMFVTAMAFIDPWDRDSQDGWRRSLTPRIHVGGDISTAGEANQVFAGFSWTTDVNDLIFVEGGFGGSLNDGKLKYDGHDSPALGSHILFHEYAALGLNIDRNWRVIAEIEHSSHANLADGPNNGLSRAGVLIGYKF